MRTPTRCCFLLAFLLALILPFAQPAQPTAAAGGLLYPATALYSFFGAAPLEDTKISGSITAAWNGSGTEVAGSTTKINAPASSVLAISLQGTFTATLQFEGTIDGTTWFAITGLPVTGGTGVTSATATGQWYFQYAGLRQARVRCSAFTSGPVTVFLNATSGAPSATGAGGSMAVTQGTTPWTTQGAQANGTAVSTNPFLVSGQFGGNVKLLALDTNGALTANQGTSNAAGTASWPVMGAVGAGAAVAGNPVLNGARDASGNAQFVGGNNNGFFAQGPAAAGAVPGGNPLLLGAVDPAGGTTINPLQTQAAATPNLRSAIYEGANLLSVRTAGGADGTLGGLFGAAIINFNLDYNGATWDRHRNNINASIRADGTVVTIQTVNTDIINYNGSFFQYHAHVGNYNGGTLTVKLQWKDANGLFVDIPGATTGGLTSGADIILQIGPTAWPANTATMFNVNWCAPRLIRVVETIATASITFGSSYDLHAN